jgi:arabinan endo-1,5-alpha-L-arabinosidase
MRAAGRFVAALLLVGVVAALTGCSSPPGAQPLRGDLAAHDPALVVGQHGSPSFVYSTGDPTVDGGALQIRRSLDGVHWSGAGSVWATRPAWIAEMVPGAPALWAPELLQHDGTWYLYYAVSTFGSNHSAIGLATNTTLDPTAAGYRWVDRGAVLVSQTSDPYNAIDPALVVDASGTPWMAFGSFWSGIQLVELAWPSGMRADDTPPVTIAGGRASPDAIEGSQLVRHGSRFYLFASVGFCCRGAQSTYQVVVGRSDAIDGPYLDKRGLAMLTGGGTIVLSTRGSRVGPGGESYSRGRLGFHYYDADHSGRTTLAIAPVVWGDDGWPTVRW